MSEVHGDPRLAALLQQLGLASLAPVFHEESIDLVTLRSMGADGVVEAADELGLAADDMRKLAGAIFPPRQLSRGSSDEWVLLDGATSPKSVGGSPGCSEDDGPDLELQSNQEDDEEAEGLELELNVGSGNVGQCLESPESSGSDDGGGGSPAGDVGRKKPKKKKKKQMKK